MNSKLKKFLSAGAFLLFFLCGLILLYHIFSWKDTSGDYFSSVNQMYSMKKNTVDVSFFGPSSYYTALNLAVFWEDCGIASFNAAVSGQDRNASTYFIKEMLKSQSPKIVMVSATYLIVDHYAVQGNLLRNTLSLRGSLNAIELVRELVPENGETSGDNGVKDYLLRWPILHSRYRELKREDFVSVRSNDNCLGYVYGDTANVIEQFGPDSFDRSAVTPISDDVRQWIDELASLGEQEGFQLLVVSVPMELGAQERASLNGCYAYLDEKGIPFLDMNYLLDEMDFQPSHDMTDGNHANTDGAIKISRYLAEYLSETFSLPDRREQRGYERYDACLRNYHHRLFVKNVLPYADSMRLSDYIDGTEGLIAAINLKPGIPESASAFAQLLLDDGVPGEELSRGGTWIVADGTVVCRPQPKQYGYAVNESEYLYVTPSGTPGFDSISVGKTDYFTPFVEGCCVITYDTVLEKIIDVRKLGEETDDVVADFN